MKLRAVQPGQVRLGHLAYGGLCCFTVSGKIKEG